jgi:Protein of unknown function (DUF2400)
MSQLGARLEALYRDVDTAERLAADPVAFLHRYTDPADQEVAGVLASCLAFGRVAAFRPVLDQVFALADRRGGPRAWVDGFRPERDGPGLSALYYRWSSGSDLVLLVLALQGLLRRAPSLESYLGAAQQPRFARPPSPGPASRGARRLRSASCRVGPASCCRPRRTARRASGGSCSSAG